MITVVTHVLISVPVKAFAGSHALEISLQNCEYAKQVALTIMKKKNNNPDVHDQLILKFKITGLMIPQSPW